MRKTGSVRIFALAQESAVGNVEHGTVYEHRRIEREPADRLGHFLRLSGAPGVDALHQLRDALGLRFLEKLGVDRSRRYRVDLNAVRPEIGRKATREAHHAGFGDP